MSIIDTLVTDRTENDVQTRTAKGKYDWRDLNRVTEAMEYLDGILTDYGYASGYTYLQIPHQDGTSDTRWREDDETMTQPNLEAYRLNVVKLRAQFAQVETTPPVPDSMEFLTWGKANAIEQILMDIDILLTNMTAAWFYSGEIYAGEV